MQKAQFDHNSRYIHIEVIYLCKWNKHTQHLCKNFGSLLHLDLRSFGVFFIFFLYPSTDT